MKTFSCAAVTKGFAGAMKGVAWATKGLGSAIAGAKVATKGLGRAIKGEPFGTDCESAPLAIAIALMSNNPTSPAWSKWP